MTLTITDRQTGEQVSLEECAREHGMGEFELVKGIYVLVGSNTVLHIYNYKGLKFASIPFNSSRFKLEITND